MTDDLFDQLVYSDVSEWLRNHDEQRAVLLFPPLLNKYRFRIHQLIQQDFPTLRTVSVGQEESRRTAVYPAEILVFQRPSFTPRPSTMERAPSSHGKKVRPSTQPYVPPALRNHDSEAKTPQLTAKRKENNVLTSTKTKPAEPTFSPSTSRPEPEAETVSPHQYFRKPDATSPSSTSATVLQGSIEVPSTKDNNYPEIISRNESSEKPRRASNEINSELASLSLAGSSKHIRVQPNGIQTPPREHSGDAVGSVRVLRRPSSKDSAYPQTPPEHKVVSKELSDSILEELTAAFGESTTLYEPATSYRQYAPVDFEDGEAGGYSHVLEAYDFPSSFVTEELTKDIQLITQEFFDLRWVDDTHALVIFSSDGAARRAFRAHSPTARVKLRPLPEASEQGKKKARACAQSDTLSPFKHRPETSASAARRMVAGALGIKIDVPKEKREQERRQLTDAKQEKVLTAKRKEDVWEGLV